MFQFWGYSFIYERCPSCFDPDWKYVLSFELTTPGFDFSLLSECRQRLLESQQEEQILGILLQ